MQMKTPMLHDAHRGSSQQLVSSVCDKVRGIGIGRSLRLTLVALAISAGLVCVEFQQILDRLLVLGCLIGSSASRHGEWAENGE
jgi:hypothetical protein